ncbi:uncharacterized protein LOC135840818 isoform X2 [Planococcus citri]|uniref:uncharacterized protein LOC135840818 isoform X2 n=1 Tax=Planococcus citri TaxID=170843 RepID=UPI0031F92F60
MAEDLTNVYDILFPSPPPLKEIAAISIALGLWRQEINSHRIKNTLNQLNLEQDILSSDSLPRIPATIIPLIKIYIRRAGLSIRQWVDDHSIYHENLFRTEIFNDFTDFVGDFDGTIHYVRTARRLVQCDRIDNILRFKIACWYCFEDDIIRIWPSVSNDVKYTNVSFSSIPLPYYWICRLKNQLYKLPRSNSAGRSVEEQIFRNSSNSSHAWSLKEYFWNRFDVDSRMRIAKKPPVNFTKIFSRYLLAKFNELELDEFVKGAAYWFIAALLNCKSSSKLIYVRASPNNDDFQSRALYFRAMWVLIKNRMDGRRIFRLIRRIARMLYSLMMSIDTSVYCELWNTIPDNVKPEVIRSISEENSLFTQEYSYYGEVGTHSSGLFNFLLTMLSDASVEEKNQFWSKNWIRLINRLAITELNQLLSLCFNDDENKIIEFKTTSLTTLQSTRTRCSKLLNDLSFKELNEYLNFCYPDEQTRKTMCVSLLSEEFKLNYLNLGKVSPLLRDFINDAYDDVNLATDFKTQLLFSPSLLSTFKNFIDSRTNNYLDFHHVLLAIDILAPSEQIARDFKKLHIYPIFERKLRGGFLLWFAEGQFLNFLRECLGSDDEIASFKETLSMDEIVQRMIRTAMTASFIVYGGPKYNSFLEQLLEWYFNTPQALEEFKAKYADDDVFVMLTTRT